MSIPKRLICFGKALMYGLIPAVRAVLSVCLIVYGVVEERNPHNWNGASALMWVIPGVAFFLMAIPDCLAQRFARKRNYLILSVAGTILLCAFGAALAVVYYCFPSGMMTVLSLAGVGYAACWGLISLIFSGLNQLLHLAGNRIVAS